MSCTGLPQSILLCFAGLVACRGGTDDVAESAPDASGASPAAAAGDSLPDAVLGVTWQWVRTVTPVERIEAAEPSRYTISLNADGGVTVQFDCNRGNGSYEVANNQITFGAFAVTRMACTDDTQDAIFMSQLGQITSYFVQDDQLFLEMPVDGGTMRFQAQ